MHWSWQTYGMCIQNGTQKDFPGQWYSLLPQFFFISFPHPASQYCEGCVCVCVYIHIWLHRDWIEVPLLTNNTCCKWNILDKSGAAQSLTGYLSLCRHPGIEWVNTRHGMKCFTIPTIRHWFKCPNENQMSIPFPLQWQLQCFGNDTWMVCTGSFCSLSLFLCDWTVNTFWQTPTNDNN